MPRADWLHEPHVDRGAFGRENGTEAGEILWQVIENVRAWVAAGEAGRAGLVLPLSPDVEDRHRDLQPVAPRLAHLEEVVRETDAAGTAERREAVAHTASCVAEWAEGTGAYATALGYAQAAAALLPEDPWSSYHVGRLARKMGAPRHAVAWLRRAAAAARARPRPDTGVLVLEGLGHVHRSGGRIQRARSYYRRAFAAARDEGLTALAGDMHADLCLTELELGNLPAAVEHLEQALARFATGDLRISQLAHESAWLLMDSYGVFHPPFQVFDALLDHVWEPRKRLLLHAHRARAAAGVRLFREFETSWSEAFTLAARPDTHRVRAPALIQLSLAAALLRNFERARYALSRAVPPSRPGREEDATAAELHRALDSDRPLEESWPELSPPSPTAAQERDARRLCMAAVVRLRLHDRGDLVHPGYRKPTLRPEAPPQTVRHGRA